MPRKKKRKENEDKNIEQVLEDLDIDPDLDPEDVAYEAFSKKKEVTVEETPATSTVVEETPQETPQEVSTQETTTPPTPFPDPDAFPVSAVPPPAPPRGKVKPKTIAANKMSAKLSSKMPGQETVKVYKRIDGKLGYIKNFNVRDLDRFSDMETFLNQYIRPSYGAGEYEIVGMDIYNREANLGTVVLLDPDKGSAAEASGAFSFAQHVLDRQQDWFKQQQQQPNTSTDPISQMRQLMGLQKDLKEESKEMREKEAAAQKVAQAESSSLMGNMMQMMMFSMEQSRQQTTQMLATLAQPKEDPILATLLAKLLEDKSSSHPLPPPPPPPPPQKDPIESVAMLITALSTAGLLGGGAVSSGDSETKEEFLKMMLQRADAERMGPKEIIEIMQALKAERGTDDFKKAADNMAMMHSLLSQFKQTAEGSPSASFWDAIGALFSNRDFAGSIARSMRSKAEQSQLNEIDEGQQKLILQRQALQQAEIERRRLEETLRRERAAARELRQAVSQSTSQEQEAPASETKKTHPPPSPVSPAVEQTAPKGDVQLQLPPLPEGIDTQINELINAKDDAGRIEATIRMLTYLAEHEAWQEFTRDIFEAAQGGDLRLMLRYLAIFFEHLVSIQLLDVNLAKRVLITTKDNFEIIHRELSKGPIPEIEGNEEFDYLADFEENDPFVEEGDEDQDENEADGIETDSASSLI